MLFFRRFLLPAFALVLATSACSGPPAHRQLGAVVTDSAGVTIVSSPAAMQAFEHWTLAPDPEVRIGSGDSGPQYQLYRVRGAVRLSTGDVVVANGGTEELRWYDPGGTYRFTRGGEGQGPGQYRSLRALLVLGGDSVLAEDPLNGAIHMYSPGGELVRSWRIGKLGAFTAPPPFARLADGTFVALAQHPLSSLPGLVRFEAMVVRYRDGQVLDTVARSAGSQEYLTRCGSSGQTTCTWDVPFGVKAHAVAHDTRIVVGNGDGYALKVYDPSGKLTAIYRRNLARKPLNAALRSRYVDSVVALYPPERRAQAHRALSMAPAPDSLPSFTNLMMDALGDTWVALPDTAAAESAPWDVLGPDGAYLTTVEVPRGLELTQIGDTFLMGIMHDADGGESVEVYRIAKGA